MVNSKIKCENMLKNTAGKRYDFVDVAKGIGILFVLFAHVNYTPSLLIAIYSFHMPIFFVMSGMLFNRNNYSNFGNFIKRKLQTLICPYVLFYVLAILFSLAVGIVANIDGINMREIGGHFLQIIINQGSGKVLNTPLWFIPCLFVVEIVYFFVSRLKKPLIIIVSVILTSLGWLLESGIIPFDNKVLPWSIDSACFSIGFFAIGNLSFDYVCAVIEKIKTRRSKYIIYILTFLFAAGVLLPLAFYNGKVSIGSRHLNNGFIFYVTGVLGLIAIFALSVWWEKSNFLKYCGRNSFQIMGIHCVVLSFLRLIYKLINIPLYDETRFVETIIPVIIVTVLSLLFVVVYNKIKFIIKSYSRSVK